jgi:hypothetical protein
VTEQRFQHPPAALAIDRPQIHDRTAYDTMGSIAERRPENLLVRVPESDSVDHGGPDARVLVR